jgi:hypothetical protein
MPKKSSTANQELADHQLDMQAGSANAAIASKRLSDKEVKVGQMSAEELENFKQQRQEEERRDSPWGKLFT